MGMAHMRDVVLVVEDDDEIRTVIVDELEVAGYHAIPASNGRQALEFLEANPGACCLVLLDLMMPVMSGWDVLATLEGAGALANQHILVMSAASAPEESVPAGLKVLRKPMPLATLLQEVRTHCAPA